MEFSKSVAIRRIKEKGHNLKQDYALFQYY